MQQVLDTLKTRLRQSPAGARQFIKFCIVGGANTMIDWVLAWLLIHYAAWPLLAASRLAEWGLPFKPETMSIWLIKLVSSGTATCNSFIWNRRWTFGVRGKQGRNRQFAQFVTVNVTGMLLNATITTLLLRNFMPKPPFLALIGAQATATGIVVFWNFFMNKHWTFKTTTSKEITL
ncbi:MAG: GtrA family protein [Fimbriimonadia bacterium]|nr:GtrA family protein [Fimbriimonadia bacterium]